MGRSDLLGPIGAFGKMPSLGDFFRFDLPPGFASAWDGWLSETLSQVRRSLGGRWQESYNSAPIWRFTLEAGLAGPNAVLGVLMPSVDRVGRAFPLTLVAPVNAGSVGAAGHLAQSAGFMALEDVALDALEFSMTQAGLRRGLAEAGARFGEETAPVEDAPPAFGMAGARAQWSALVDGRMLYLATPGLPSARELAAMLDPADPRWNMEAAQ